MGEGQLLAERTVEDDRQPSDALIDAVAAASGRDPTDIPPLHGDLDLEGLDTFVESVRGRCSVTVEVARYVAHIQSDGEIRVYVSTTDG